MNIITETYTWGNITLEVKKTVILEGYQTPLVLDLVFPQYQKTVKAMLEAIDPTSANAGKEYERILHNSRWYPSQLPVEAINPQGLSFLGHSLPKWSDTAKIWAYVKSLNPTDNSREGNTNWLNLPNGQRISVGSYWGMCLGIPQSRIAPSGGIAGTAHPATFLATLAKLAGADFTVNSLSPMYDKARNLLTTRQAKEQEQAKAQKAKEEQEQQEQAKAQQEQNQQEQNQQAKAGKAGKAGKAK